MGRNRRQLISGKVYEIIPRLKEGLPFVCASYMNMILLSILARVQRDSKVTLCHFVGMANHFHIIVVVRDKQQAANFVQEFKKKATEALKRLHGLQHLSIWEPNTAPILLPTAADVEERIRYLYSNPANAHLVDSIEEYPGISSWAAFKNALLEVDAEVISEHYWLTSPSLPWITKGVSAHKDLALCEELRSKAKDTHELKIEPYAWLRSFGKTDAQAAKERIVAQIKETEAALRRIRKEKKHGVFSPSRLRNEIPKLFGYRPKKKERKLFVICHDNGLRFHIIAQFKEFCHHCRKCYQRMCQGEIVQWPPAAFIPPFRGVANALCWSA